MYSINKYTIQGLSSICSIPALVATSLRFQVQDSATHVLDLTNATDTTTVLVQ
jgi:hypothetical protein